MYMKSPETPTATHFEDRIWRLDLISGSKAIHLFRSGLFCPVSDRKTQFESTRMLVRQQSVERYINKWIGVFFNIL